MTRTGYFTQRPSLRLCQSQDVPSLAALLATATDAGPPNRAAATQAAAQAAAAAGPLKPGSAQLGLSAYRDSRAARIFQDEERTEEDDLVRL